MRAAKNLGRFMESIFALLQNNVLDRQRWPTRDQLRTAIITWIERTCHRRPLRPDLPGDPPIAFETTMNQIVTLAA